MQKSQVIYNLSLLYQELRNSVENAAFVPLIKKLVSL